MPSGDDGTGFKGVFDEAGDTLRCVYGTACVVISLFKINGSVRPQAESSRPTTVIKDTLALVQFFERGANVLLFRMVNTCKSADDRFLGRQQVAVV